MKEKLFSVTLKDCDVMPYRGSGAGGQKRNKTYSAIRVTHKESGAAGECENYREQTQNKRHAFSRMFKTKKFQSWIKLEASRKMGKLRKIEEDVDREMKKVSIDVKDKNGRWVNETTNNISS